MIKHIYYRRIAKFELRLLWRTLVFYISSHDKANKRNDEKFTEVDPNMKWTYPQQIIFKKKILHISK